MKSIRFLGALAAILALSGLATSQALATETLAFTPQSGKLPVKGVTLKSGSGGIDFTQETTVYGCSSMTAEGEITGRKTAKLKFVFKGCGTPNGTQCHTLGAPEGEIKTETLPVELVYTSKAKHEAALDLNYEEPTEAFPPPPHKQLATWYCKSLFESGPYGIRGSILAPITPVNTLTNTFKLKLTEKEHKQTPTTYETEAGKAYTAFPEMALISEFYSEGALWGSTQAELAIPTLEGKLEIKA
jgi:hypothetical protein